MSDTDIDIAEWLQSLPLDEAVEIDGETVYLRIRDGGAELGGYFLTAYDDTQLQAALKTGFESALEFDAGWSISPEDQALLLTQWLPYVGSWEEAQGALENLLDQMSVLREAMSPSDEPEGDDFQKREEQRMRLILTGERR